MYINYADYDGNINEGDVVLMSAEEFKNGGKNLMGVPVVITPDGQAPVENEVIEE